MCLSRIRVCFFIVLVLRDGMWDMIVSFLDHCLSFYFDTSLYDKRHGFHFPIVNFLYLSSNIPLAPAYAVCISQLVCYARACCKYKGLIDRGKLPTSKLLSKGYEYHRAKLVSTIKSFLGDIMPSFTLPYFFSYKTEFFFPSKTIPKI